LAKVTDNFVIRRFFEIFAGAPEPEQRAYIIAMEATRATTQARDTGRAPEFVLEQQTFDKEG
jgi:hypothetical protein